MTDLATQPNLFSGWFIFNSIALAVVLIILVVLVLRIIVLWYWRVNRVVDLLEKIEENTRPIDKQE